LQAVNNLLRQHHSQRITELAHFELDHEAPPRHVITIVITKWDLNHPKISQVVLQLTKS
jgi:hypothetical protein